MSSMPSTRASSAGYILVGGQSSRMGADKAFLQFRGLTLLERAIATVRAACDSATIVGDVAKFSPYGTVIPDLFPGCGPLAGIHSSLRNTPADLTFMMAVDMPLVSAGLVSFLLAKASETDACIVLPRTSSGSQPLCAVYRRAFAAVAEDALHAGRYKIDSLFDKVSVRYIEQEELTRAGFREQMFFNVNTPEDLGTARSDE